MIFVTVGTHEQPFERLIKYIDNLKLDEEIIIQSGYCNYSIKNCKYKKMMSIEEMDKYFKNARIIITHAGPGSIMKALSLGKKPIVVAREVKYKEHVDDHQVLFASSLEKENKIINVKEISNLERLIKEYDTFVKDGRVTFVSNNKNFNDRFKDIVNDLFKGDR